MELRKALVLDAVAETERISGWIRAFLGDVKRRGAVVGLSGGIDSSVTAALCVRAIGNRRVFGVLMPESDSSPESLELGRLVADTLGITSTIEDISGILRGAGCYERRDAAIRTVIPAYGEGYKCKIVLPSAVAGRYQLFSIIVRSPDGAETAARLPLEAYLTIVAATNFKQRARTMIEYFHADRLNYAVAGTPNWVEYDQGFFVKNGDGAADFRPIAHLFKSQVYQLAEYVGIPARVQERPPTTDTYSLEQSQEEFFFNLPHEKMDMAIYARDHGIKPAEAGSQIGFSEDQMRCVFNMIDSKRLASRYLQMPPRMLEEVCQC
jgi:NAD+ synthase